MLALPPLVAGVNRWVLPMAGRSADVLAELLLGDAAAGPDDRLAAALAGDPPLLLWAVCTAARRDDLQGDSVDDVARWLGEHLPQVLCCDGRQPPVTAEPERVADHLERCLCLADLAAQLAVATEPSAVEAARLLGLLHEADCWLAMAGEPPANDAASPLPRWLIEPKHAPAAEAMQLAAGVLDGRQPLPDGSPIDLDACRRRAAEARRRWLSPGTALGNHLPQLAARLARLADLENRFLQTLETEKLEAMAEFAAGAGHEINNPLTVIAGRAQLFLREETDPERRRALALISAQAMRVYEMIADMMLFARPALPEPEPVELVELVDRVVAELTPRAEAQATQLRRTGEDGPVPLEVDPMQIAMALQAMVRNALEAIGRRGQIEISVRAERQGAEIRITDDGPGLTADEHRHVFDPYYSARQAGRGLGLGLSKAWRIVTNHGGRIDVASQPGQGAVFTVTLPGQFDGNHR